MNITATAEKLKANNNINPTEYDMATEYGVDLFDSHVYAARRPEPQTKEELINAWLEGFGFPTGETIEPEDGVEGALKNAWHMAAMHEDFMYEQARRVEREINTLIAAEREANKCTRCNGNGYLAQYHYWRNGECFKCGGTGMKSGYDLLRADQ